MASRKAGAPEKPATERDRPVTPDSQPTDVGRTSGGGSLGHDQPPDVESQTHTRNAARTPARPDPAIPNDDSTKKTKI